MIFKSDTEYNEMWEHCVLLMTRDILSNITPALSKVVPAGQLQEIKSKLSEWTNQLQIIIDNDIKEGKIKP